MSLCKYFVLIFEGFMLWLVYNAGAVYMKVIASWRPFNSYHSISEASSVVIRVNSYVSTA